MSGACSYLGIVPESPLTSRPQKPSSPAMQSGRGGKGSACRNAWWAAWKRMKSHHPAPHWQGLSPRKDLVNAREGPEQEGPLELSPGTGGGKDSPAAPSKPS